MDQTMPEMTTTFGTCRRWLWAAFAAAVLGLALPAPGQAQVVVVANGSPITELDIQQRMRLIASSTRKPTTRQDVINELIDDRLKISKAKYYGLEVSDSELDSAFENLARRQNLTPQQFQQFLERSGVSAAAVKARMRAEITWTQLIRGKYSSALQIGDSDVANALRARNEGDGEAKGYLYTLYPVTVVVPRGSSDGVRAAKIREAEALRSRFTSCKDGLAMARGLRDVAVREPINRSSADLAPQLAQMLASLDVGRLSAPEVTGVGVQMFALCAKKESTAETAAKRQVREQLFTQRYEAEAKKFLDEIRKSAMIEYKK